MIKVVVEWLNIAENLKFMSFYNDLSYYCEFTIKYL